MGQRILLFLNLLTIQMGYLQVSGYCIALVGNYLVMNATSTITSTLRSQRFLIFVAIAASLFFSTFVNEMSSVPPLARFLQNSGLGKDKTLFITMATEGYMDAVFNFKLGLDKFDLGGNCVVLCLDKGCVERAKEHNICAYDSYVMNGDEAGGDYHVPVARAKVISSKRFVSNRRWRQILN